MFPKLTKEEFKFLLKEKKNFFNKYKIVHVPLYRQIAMSIQSLAVSKLMEGKKKDAMKHHIKACIYYPEIATSHSIFRKEVGLPVLK